MTHIDKEHQEFQNEIDAEVEKSNKNVIKVFWFSDSTSPCYGIVAIKDPITKEVKAYCGLGHGADEQYDIRSIRTVGSKVNIEELSKFFADLNKKK